MQVLFCSCGEQASLTLFNCIILQIINIKLLVSFNSLEKKFFMCMIWNENKILFVRKKKKSDNRIFVYGG